MPLKLSKKIMAKKAKSKTVYKKRNGFPSEKIVSLNLAKCAKASFLNIMTRLEMSQRNSKKKIAEKKDGFNSESLKFDEEEKMPSTSNASTTENISARAKKKRKKNVVKREGKLFRRAGKKFIRTFVYFSRAGETYARCNSISYPKTLWWLKRAGIVDNYRVTIRDVEVHFINQLKGGYELKILQFIRFLKSLCEDRGLHMSTVLSKLIGCRQNKTVISNNKTRLYNGKIIRGYKLNPAHRKKANFPSTKFKKNKVKKVLKNGKIKSENEVNGKNSREDLWLRTLVHASVGGIQDNSNKCKTAYLMQESTPINFKEMSPVWLKPSLIPVPHESRDFLKKVMPEQTLLEKSLNKMSNNRSSRQLKGTKMQGLKGKNKDKAISVQLDAKLPMIHNDGILILGLNEEILKKNSDEDNYAYVPSETSSHNLIVLKNMQSEVHYENARDLGVPAKKSIPNNGFANRTENILQKTEKNVKKFKKFAKKLKNKIDNSSMGGEAREIVYIESIALEGSKEGNTDKDTHHRNENIPKRNLLMNKRISKSIYSTVDRKSQVNKNFTGTTYANAKNEIERIHETPKAENKNISLTAEKFPDNKVSKSPYTSTKNKHTLPKLKTAHPHKNFINAKDMNCTVQSEKLVTTRRKVKNQRTFTNLPISKVQKALSDSRKLKIKNALNSKLDSNSKTLGTKSNPKVRSKHRKLKCIKNKEQESIGNEDDLSSNKDVRANRNDTLDSANVCTGTNSTIKTASKMVETKVLTRQSKKSKQITTG